MACRTLISLDAPPAPPSPPRPSLSPEEVGGEVSESRLYSVTSAARLSVPYKA